MTAKLKREDLWSLEQYAEKRNDFRAQVIEHKKSRQVAIGPNATLYFEDRMVMQYQVQEMLRIERIFEKDAIQEELDAYNPLIPDGSNWKATFMLEYPDVEQRKQELAKLLGVEKKVWVRVGELDKVYPIANEDLERETEEKTSSVHFLRFELSPEMVTVAKSGAAISMGIDHDAYNYTVDPVAENIRQSLVADLD
ncbi:MAG: DUF3501 family protein [Acidiferrobacterales bacterium]|nr:DUF3501 family protein [Acidiferrobacterales bacterium]